MNKEIFEPGDIFKFRNKEYMVIQNYGSTGLIKECIENGMIIKGFSWEQGEDKCIFIRKESDSTAYTTIKEYENFFEKYKV